MSTVVTFGYIKNAGPNTGHPIAYRLLDEGEQWDQTDLSMLAVDYRGDYAHGPLPGMVGYYAAQPGVPMVVTLACNYWAVPVFGTPAGSTAWGTLYHRDYPVPPVRYGLGESIRVSAAEAACLRYAGALATW